MSQTKHHVRRLLKNKYRTFVQFMLKTKSKQLITNVDSLNTNYQCSIQCVFIMNQSILTDRTQVPTIKIISDNNKQMKISVNRSRRSSLLFYKLLIPRLIDLFFVLYTIGIHKL